MLGCRARGDLEYSTSGDYISREPAARPVSDACTVTMCAAQTQARRAEPGATRCCLAQVASPVQAAIGANTAREQVRLDCLIFGVAVTFGLGGCCRRPLSRAKPGAIAWRSGLRGTIAAIPVRIRRWQWWRRITPAIVAIARRRRWRPVGVRRVRIHRVTIRSRVRAHAWLGHSRLTWSGRCGPSLRHIALLCAVPGLLSRRGSCRRRGNCRCSRLGR